MKQTALLVSLLFVCACLLPALEAKAVRERAARLTLPELQSAVEFLGHDLLEGRAPGTRGGELAENYVESMFKMFGLEPGVGDGYRQPFTLKGFRSVISAIDAGGQALQFPGDIVGVCPREIPGFTVEGEAVFCGFGIASDLWQWDDFKNVDVKDKILIVRASDPGHYDPKLFEGSIMTYFGRWTYKIEEAIRRGARGILIVHTDDAAGYDWNVVINSWSKENLFLPAALQNNLEFRGWIKEEALKRVLAANKIDIAKLYKLSLQKKFKPQPLGFRVRVQGTNEFRETRTSNIVGKISGKSDRCIVFSAHTDHLGRNPKQSGDNIYNGAIDNGSAVAAMLLTAKLLKEFQAELPYTVVFLACQAEEEGLLGSRYFVAQADRSKIIANINYESSPVWGETRSVVGVGARFSTFEDRLKEISAANGLQYEDFTLNDRGFFYRSDQFPFALCDIPAVWVSAGDAFVDGRHHIFEYFTGPYHTVKDEYDPTWEFTALKQTVQLGLELVAGIDKPENFPRWKTRLTFPVVK